MKKTMPEILRELRNENKATQSDMANLLGLTTNAYQSYERGTSEPSCKALCILADFYKVSTDYLLGRTPVRAMNILPVGALSEEEVKDIDAAIVTGYTQLSLETRRMFIKMLEDLFGNIFEREDYGMGEYEDLAEDPQDSTA